MASLDEMTRAGYKPAVKESSTDQILKMVSGVQEQAQKQQEKQKADTMDQVKLYGELRKAGYSPEDAHAKVTRTYRSTGFIERLLTGQADSFQRPTGPDEQQIAATKQKAEIGETKAKTRKTMAQAGYYERGGPSRKGYEGLTPNQIQSRIKSLREQIGMGEEEDDANLESEIGYLNDLFQKKAGFKQEGEVSEIPAGSPSSQAPSGKPVNGSVVMTGPDGKKYKIPKQNVEKARARGFK